MSQIEKTMLMLLAAGFAAGCPFAPAPAPKKAAPTAAPIAARPTAIQSGEAEPAPRNHDESGNSSAGVSDALGTVADASAASTDAADSDARPLETLYICHVAFFEAPAGTPICEVRFQYDDGTTESDQIVSGSDVRDWFVNTPDEELGPSGKRSTLAWSGEGLANDRPQKIRLCLTAIPNPHPAKTVQTIDLVSTKTRAASSILAMTTGKAGLMKPARPAEEIEE